MIYELSTNNGRIIGTYPDRSGFPPIGVCYRLARLDLKIGEKANIDGITYKRIS